MNRIYFFIAFCFILAFANTISAQSSTIDVVYLKNGTIIKGEIIEIIPNLHLKIKTFDGSLFVFEIKDIEKIIKEEVSQSKSLVKRHNQEPIYKNFKEYRNPLVSTFTSFILPGIGQFYNGQTNKGLRYMFLNFISYGLVYYSSNQIFYNDSDGNKRLSSASFSWRFLAIVSSIGGVSNWIVSMVDANKSSKKINRQLGFANIKLGERTNLSFSPDVKLVNNYSLINSTSISPSYGLNMRISF